MQGIAARRPELGDQPANTAPSAMVGLVASKALETTELSVESVSGVYHNTPREQRNLETLKGKERHESSKRVKDNQVLNLRTHAVIKQNNLIGRVFIASQAQGTRADVVSQLFQNTNVDWDLSDITTESSKKLET